MTLDSVVDVGMTPTELDKLKTFDSCLYGQIDLLSPEAAPKKNLLLKGIQYLENELIRCNRTNSPVSPSLLCTLGHIHLLLEDYTKALSAYQKYYNSDQNYWKNAAFLYGLGIVYSQFNHPQWSTQAFQQVLYTEPNFSRASDVNFRIGLMLKNNADYEGAIKHFRLAKSDSGSSLFLKYEVKFHLAHIQELQSNYTLAKTMYEQILQGANIPNPIRANVLRQLGWLHHSYEVFGDVHHRESAAIEYLKKSIDSDSSSGQSWYYLGRCYSTVGKVHEAFVAYRQSIDKSEASADTWCSIGILYQQQSQPMDALQAYICAVQLNKGHVSAWTNLGMLYESCSQFKDALHCYQNGLKGHKNANPSVAGRVKLLQSHLGKLSQAALQDAMAGRPQSLPCVEEAFHLPIPAEVTSRQQAAPGTLPVHPSTNQNQGGQQAANPVNLKKRRASSKKKSDSQPPAKQESPPPFYLSSKEMQTLHYYQANLSTLNPSQQQHLHQLRQHYFMQQQHMMQQNDTGFLPSQVEQVDTVSKLADMTNTLVAGQDIIPGEPPLSTNSMGPEGKQDIVNDNITLKPSKPVESKADMATVKLTAAQILQSCKGRGLTNARGSPNISSEYCRPPAPPPVPKPTLSIEHLSPSTPTLTIDSKKDALSPDLKRLCMDQPIVLVKGLAATLKLNLGLFSTRTLVETALDHPCEVRTQRKFELDETLDQQGNRTWKQESTRAYSTIAKYAQYQASSFQESLKAETSKASAQTKPAHQQQRSQTTEFNSDSDSNLSGSHGMKKKLPPMIRFGTNVDLSDREKWKEQLMELQKLPSWLRVHWAGNALSHLGHTVLGMNSVQLYMKIPGCRTPGHQENLNFCSVNLNIGPGDCEWFGVPEQYWGVLNNLCEKNQIKYLSGAWWPLPEDLIEARVPLYKFTQKPGDLVWVTAGCVHWVQATGWCNNIAWNVGPLDSSVFKLAVERYEWNKLQSYKSIIPMIHLAWNLAKNIKQTDEKLYDILKQILLRSLEHTGLVTDMMAQKGKPIQWHGRQEGEAPHYCYSCEVEVFNILFVCEVEKKHVVYCLDCALKLSPGLDNFVVLREHAVEDLAHTYDNFKLGTGTNPEIIPSIASFTPSVPTSTH